MGLTPDVVQAHIDQWETTLNRGNRRYRRNWPSRLFRHEPIENAVEILRSGHLLSRADVAGQQPVDIAPDDIINVRAAAHNLVRLYFRPKNPTQYRIEGIQKPHEYYLGKHAPVLVIMVFSSQQILTLSDTQFSDGNMQRGETITGSTDADFVAIPFDEVYHEGTFDVNSATGQEILRRRCAEVLLPSPLPLEGTLQGILCRSPAERATLVHLLRDTAERWRDRIRVFTEPGLFESRFAYLETVDGGPNGIQFTFHPRRDGNPVRTEVTVTDQNNVVVISTRPDELNTGGRWKVEAPLPPGAYNVLIRLEDCFAHQSTFIVDDLPF